MKYQVCIINIGNELLLGQTVNTNLSWLGKQLANLGLPITRSVTIQDVPAAITSTLSAEWQTHDIVIITGGLGPTDDDLTKQTIADFFGKELEFHEDIWQQVQSIFARREIITPEINRSQAMVPQDFVALANHRGTAPGLYYQADKKSLFALPGVPTEMKYLFSEYIKDILSEQYDCEPVFIKTWHTWDIGESALAEKLAELKLPEGVQLAWLPQTGRVDLRIYGAKRELVESTADDIYKQVKHWIWGSDDDKPQSVLYKLMTEQKLTLAVAESCTGGLVEELITGIPGASQYFLGGIVSYSNAIKEKQLHVLPKTLEQYGAVSTQTAVEMALGIRLITEADFGISITGIAGPEGGTEDKPVGTVCFAISDKKQIISNRMVFNGDRHSIRFKAAEYILLLLIDYIRSRG
jgi:nicotinamide-nucleotide amidase